MSLRRRAIASAIWHVATSIGGRVVGVVSTLVITWFLSPEIVGQVSVASILVISTRLCVGLGVGQYVAAHPEASRSIVFHVTLLNLALTAIAAAVVLGAGGAIGAWLGAPASVHYIPGLTIALVASALAEVPERLLVRSLGFRTLGLSLAGSEVAYAVSSVGLAALGFGGMAIVWANVIRAGLRLAVALLVVDPRAWLTPARLERRHFAAIISFGAPVQVGSLAAQVAYRWDNLVVSHLHGPAPTAAYNLAFNLANIPAENIGESVADVLLPSFSQLPPERRPAALARAAALLALIIFPMAVGLAAISETLVATLFNEKWQAVAPLLTILAALSVTHPLSDVLRSYFQAVRKTRATMTLQIVYALLVLVGVYGLGQLGLRGAAAGAGVAAALYGAGGLALLARIERIPWRVVLGPYLRPLLPCAVMAAAVLAVRAVAFRLGLAPGVALLLLEMSAGALSYVPAALLLAPGASRELLRIARETLARRRAAG